MLSLCKGNLAELLFERLALQSGWFVRYTGDQYRETLRPESRGLEINNQTPDFALCRNDRFEPQETLKVEVKFAMFMERWRKPKKGQEDVLVVLGPNTYKVFPEKYSEELINPKAYRTACRMLRYAIFLEHGWDEDFPEMGDPDEEETPAHR